MLRHKKAAKAASAVAVFVLVSAASFNGGAAPLSSVPGINKVLTADLGRVSTDADQSVTVYLKMKDQAGFDAAVAAVYDRNSPQFHHWMTDGDIAKFGPSEQDVETVKKALAAKGLSLVSQDPHNFSVRVRGTTRAIEAAFQTELHNFKFKDRTFQVPTRTPRLAGDASNAVAATVGLERHAVHPLLKVASDPKTGQPLFWKKITQDDPPSGIFQSLTQTALMPPDSYLLKTRTPGDTEYGEYYGLSYDQGILQFVSYFPANLQEHYGLTPLIQQGYDGRGQTVALVEAYGYSAARDDANYASSLFNLPLLTDDNFQVIYPEGQPINPDGADLVGWTPEIALDIQAVHGVAPGAKILVVNSSGQDNEDQIASLDYIISNHLASIVSCSWENDPEIISGAAEEDAFNSVLERAAAQGISINFSSGDSGDYGLGTPLGAVGMPSNSPYATSVGGTSILNNPLGGQDVVTGWGTSVSELINTLNLDDPPISASFYGGAGGGESQYFAKPSWQQSLPGAGRQVPDVSAVADPFTGFTAIITSNGEQDVAAGIGGTSLAAPIFSAIWAIAQQYNGMTLGQAAPTIASLKAGQITDVLDTNALQPYSLSGTIFDDAGSTYYSTQSLFAYIQPAIAQPNYLAAISNLHNLHFAFAITFGADTSLTVGPGWDNVTGFGEPIGLPFIQAVGAAVSASSGGSSSGGSSSSSSSSGGSSGGRSSSGSSGVTSNGDSGGGAFAPGVALPLLVVGLLRRRRRVGVTR
jgi:subtilase family serine protease